MTNHERPNDFLLEERPSLYDLTTALRWMTTQDSHAEFVDYSDTQASYTFADDEITVRFSEQPTHMLVRLNAGQKLDLRRVSNAQIISIQAGEGYTRYVLQGMGKEVRLGLLVSD